MNKEKFILLIAGASTLALCLIVAAKVRYHQLHSPKYIDSAHMDAVAMTTLVNWKTKKYVDVRNTPEFNSNLDKLRVRIQQEPMLSAIQASNLIEAIKGFIDAFSSGEYASYKNFRLPIGFNYTVTPNGSNRINDYFMTIPPLRPVSSKFIYYWVAQYRSNKFQVPTDFNARFDRFLYENSGFNYYSNYFSGVCFDDLVIKINKYTNSVPRLTEYNFSVPNDSAGFAYITTNFPNLVYVDLGESRWRIFDVEPSMQNILAKEKNVLCASCLIFVRVQCPEETYIPFPIRFYWANKPQKWLVDNVVLANMYSSTNSNYLIVF